MTRAICGGTSRPSGRIFHDGEVPLMQLEEGEVVLADVTCGPGALGADDTESTWAPWDVVVPVTRRPRPVRLQQCHDRRWVGVGFAITGCTVFGGEPDQRALLAVVGWIVQVTQDDNGQLSDLQTLAPGCSNAANRTCRSESLGVGASAEGPKQNASSPWTPS